MDMLTLICILIVLSTFILLIVKAKWKGFFVFLFIAIGSILAASGNTFGFDGENLALIFVSVAVIIYIAVSYMNKIKKNRG